MPSLSCVKSPASPGLAPHPCGEADLEPHHLHHWQPASRNAYPFTPYDKHERQELAETNVGRCLRADGNRVGQDSCTNWIHYNFVLLQMHYITAFIGKTTLQSVLMLKLLGVRLTRSYKASSPNKSFSSTS